MFFRYLNREWLDLTGPYRLNPIPDSGKRESSDPVKQAAKTQPSFLFPNYRTFRMSGHLSIRFQNDWEAFPA